MEIPGIPLAEVALRIVFAPLLTRLQASELQLAKLAIDLKREVSPSVRSLRKQIETAWRIVLVIRDRIPDLCECLRSPVIGKSRHGTIFRGISRELQSWLSRFDLLIQHSLKIEGRFPVYEVPSRFLNGVEDADIKRAFRIAAGPFAQSVSELREISTRLSTCLQSLCARQPERMQKVDPLKSR